MAVKDGSVAPADRLGRELARERYERALHDEARGGFAPLAEDFRTKDARERIDSSNLKRHPGR